MIRNILIIIVSIFFLASCTVQKRNELQVRKTFNSYKKAILKDQGEKASYFVDKNTLNYYSDILVKVINSDSTEIDALNILDKLMVLSIRHRVSKEDILNFNGKKLFIYAIENGMVGKGSVRNSEIGEIKFNSETAKGQFIINKIKAPFYYGFNKESNEWKLDLTSIFEVGKNAFKKIQEESEQSENEFLFMILESLTGRAPNDQIWQKIKN